MTKDGSIPRTTLNIPMPQKPDVYSFQVDERTLALLAKLRETFGVTSDAAVIRKALALANIAAQYADADNTITIVSGGREVKVLLSG